MKKKGFTLIELLAVIVILAIIALIAVPIVLGLLEKSRHGAAVDSAYGVRKEAQLVYTTAAMLHPTAFNKIEVDFSKTVEKNGKTYAEAKYFQTADAEGLTSEVEFEIDGTRPTAGKITIYGNGLISYEILTINNYYCCIPEQGEITCEKENNFDSNCNYLGGSGSSEVNVPINDPGQNDDDTPTTGDDDTPTPGPGDDDSDDDTPAGDDNYEPIGYITSPDVTVSVNDDEDKVKVEITDTTVVEFCVTEETVSTNCTWINRPDSEEIIPVDDGTYHVYVKNNSDTIIEVATFNIGPIVSGNNGDAVILGGYNWHIIGQDSTRIWLLMDANVLPTNAHCSSTNGSGNNCTWNSSYGYPVYSWDKSNIRANLNGTFYNNLNSTIKASLVKTRICNDPSIYSSSASTYGGYTDTEIASLGVTCSTGYSEDYVRLITPAEFHNLSQYHAGSTYPVDNGYYYDNGHGKVPEISYITRMSSNNWLYSSSVGYWWTTGAYANGDTIAVRGALLADTGGFVGFYRSIAGYGVRPVIVLKK